MIGQQVAILHT